MRILFVADGRSPIALNWMRYFVEGGHEVHLASTFRAKPQLDLASLHFVPVAFSGRAGSGSGAGSAGGQGAKAGRIPLGLRTRLRQWAGPYTLERGAKQLRQIATEVQPDLVHAMRIPFEGILAGQAGLSAPLLVSVWGNDFTLHAASSPGMKRATRRATCRADALHADTKRDYKLSWEWGFDPVKPSLVVPGNGGIRSEVFKPAKAEPKGPATVIMPRGLRAYVRNDLFFRAIPPVLERLPDARFLCPAMQGQPEAERWVRELGIGQSVELLPKLSPAEMAEAYRRSHVTVSPQRARWHAQHPA